MELIWVTLGELAQLSAEQVAQGSDAGRTPAVLETVRMDRAWLAKQKAAL